MCNQLFLCGAPPNRNRLTPTPVRLLSYFCFFYLCSSCLISSIKYHANNYCPPVVDCSNIHQLDSNPKWLWWFRLLPSLMRPMDGHTRRLHCGSLKNISHGTNHVSFPLLFCLCICRAAPPILALPSSQNSAIIYPPSNTLTWISRWCCNFGYCGSALFLLHLIDNLLNLFIPLFIPHPLRLNKWYGIEHTVTDGYAIPPMPYLSTTTMRRNALLE